MIYLLRKREPTEKKQFLLPGQGEEEVYSHTNPPKVYFLLSIMVSQKKKRSKENLIKSKVLTTSHIRNWIRNGALEELEMVVLEGQVSL